MKIKHEKIYAFFSALGSFASLSCMIMTPHKDGWIYKAIPLILILISTGLLFCCMLILTAHKPNIVPFSDAHSTSHYLLSNIKNNTSLIKNSVIILCYIGILRIFWLIRERRLSLYLLIFMYANLFFLLYKENLQNRIVFFIADFYFLIINSFILFLVMQFLFEGVVYRLIYHPYALINMLLIFIFTMVLIFLCNNVKLGLIFANILAFAWGLANHYVFLFKGFPLQFSDVAGARTAFAVTTNYDFSLSQYYMRVIYILIMACLIALLNIHKNVLAHSLKGKLCIRMGGLTVFVLSYFLIWNTPVLNSVGVLTDYWSYHTTYEKYGVLLSCIQFDVEGKIKKPKKYSAKKVDEIQEEIELSSATTKSKPNIIAIMNESLTDYEALYNIKTSEEVFPFINSLEENTLKGNLLVSTFGGGTPRTEFEFLTSHSISFIGLGTYGYGKNIHSPHFTLVSALNEQGYKTIAMHPESGQNWERNDMYRHFAFDEFYDKEYFKGSETLRDAAFVSDRATYLKTIELLENKDQNTPLFLFNVTMQNHGGFSDESYVNRIEVEGFDSFEVNQYLTLANESDQAFQYLVEYLENYDEPTIVLLFGDHHPRLSDEFYSWANNLESVLESIQKMHITPYVMWANYDIDETLEKEIISANFLSNYLLSVTELEKTPYHEFIEELATVTPAMNVFGYLGDDGYYHTYEESTPTASIFLQYEWIQYNELFDKKERVDSMFQTPNSIE